MDTKTSAPAAPVYEEILRQAAARRRVAAAMRKQGKKYREIGAALGVSTERARQMVVQARTETEKKTSAR